MKQNGADRPTDMADEVGVEEDIAEEVADTEGVSAVVGGVDGEGGEQEDQLEDTGGGEGEEQPVEEEGSARPGNASDGDVDGEAADESNGRDGSNRGGSADGGDPDEAVSDLPDGGLSLRTESQLSWESLGSARESPRGSPLSVHPKP